LVIGDGELLMLGTHRASCRRNIQTSRPQVLQNRLISHAADILDISATLPKTPQATHISRQVAMCGDGGGSYGEARGAESRSDFVHKLRIASVLSRQKRPFFFTMY